MREDIAALLELEQKTKAREIAPLVHVERKGFFLWPSKAYHAYSHRLDIALAYLLYSFISWLVQRIAAHG